MTTEQVMEEARALQAELQRQFDSTMEKIFHSVPMAKNPTTAERAGATQAYLACAVLIACKSYRIPEAKIQSLTQEVYTFLAERITKASGGNPMSSEEFAARCKEENERAEATP